MSALYVRWWPGRLGWLVAIAVPALATIETRLGTDAERPEAVVVAMLLVGTALFLRRVSPVTTLAVAFAGHIATLASTTDGSAASVLGVIAACASAGLEMHFPRLLAAPAIVLIASILAAAGPWNLRAEPIDILAGGLLFGSAILAGTMFRLRAERMAELEAETSRLEEERAASAREAVDAERSRIARELHDIVTHSISVIAVQTQAVRRRLGPDHDEEARDLQAVETVARQAMAEMRRMLGVLRSQGNRLELEPQPGVGQLPRLLDQTRATGLAVSLYVDGKEAPLPPGVDLAAYRIVQEALTNVLKHAGATTATVTLRYGERELRVEVEDDGNGPAGQRWDGHGLIGMRERVAVYGGTLQYGGVDGRGFRVAARLPIREAALRD